MMAKHAKAIVRLLEDQLALTLHDATLTIVDVSA